MNCDDARILMHGHLDGELDLAADLEIQRHIEECPRCASEYAALLAMRTRLKDDEFRFEAPAALKEKIRRALPTPAPVRSGGYQSRRGAWMPRVARFALPLAVGAVLALAIAPRTIGPSIDQRLAGEVVASHVRSLMATHLMDVASTDQHTVKPWFNGKVTFSPPVVDLASEGFPLEGGRLDSVGARLIATLVYRRHLHRIDVFVWPAGRQTPPAYFERDGYNEISWSRNDFVFAAVSDLNAAELNAFADLLKKQ
jgi:anti-sigma factor RsiW